MMKNLFYSLFTIVLSSGLVYSQYPGTPATSFEAMEGFNLGDVDGQNGWYSNGVGNIVISDEKASEGDWSLKFVQNTVKEDMNAKFLFSDDGNFEGIYTYKVDVYISSEALNSQFMLIPNTVVPIGDETYGSYPMTVAHILNGEVTFYDINTEQGTTFDINPDEWNTFIFEIDFETNTIKCSVNDNPDFALVGFYFSTQYGFVEQAFLADTTADFYVDNITFEKQQMNIAEVEPVEFTHFMRNNELIIRSEQSIEEVSIFNLNGQKVIQTQKINTNEAKVNLSKLEKGVYIAVAMINGKLNSFKFVK